jgi:hypothetical protein
MIVVVIAGFGSAWFRIPHAEALTVAGLVMLGPPLLAFLSPFFARSGRRLLAATWVSALWPLTIPWSFYAAWILAYGFLGHAPGPADNGVVIDFLGGSIAIFVCLSLFSVILCLFLQIGFVNDDTEENHVGQLSRAIPILVIPMVWLMVYALLSSAPAGMVMWMID